ncbi:probable serine/threonine-protein kinase SIS8 [Aegilops tauschii subsp. strangulata]|uniref:non-specific serine/threonine protein kinase n=6 Tax=Triticinae TaxID=1648030 RepID=A0A453PKA7_AEGTS|nr:probable serine/threonine-protein kinase SIS8 [Aegilops tauschii subsp. strangulata]XP_044420866.1 probable serine/threonine-protein kinase SIS8 [Triticum aestivum]
MKNFFRKLHIGEGSGDGASPPAPPLPRKGSGGGGGGGGGAGHPPLLPEQRQQQPPSVVSSWLDSVPTRPPPPTPPPPAEAEGSASASPGGEDRRPSGPVGERRRAQEEGMERRLSQEGERRRSREEDAVEERVIRESSEAEERKREREKEEDDLEEFQLQLVLEMSARDNPEEMEIEVAKQMSLGFRRPASSLAEVLAARYWNFYALGYDDKITDGFYDLYVIGNGPASINMPSLSELRAQPVSHNSVNWETVLVHRGEDPELMKLEQKASIIAVELRSRNSEFVGNVLIQKLANLVSNHMGGLIFDPENTSRKYQNMIRSLRARIGSVVVPLGQLKTGLARHRALLFKVLADSLDIPCRLLKGRQYTGSDDGALNIVKYDDGREFIVDLVTDPGTVIPSEGAVLSTEFEDCSYSDNHQLSKADTANHLGSSHSGVSNSACDSFEYELLDRRSTSSNVGPSDTDGAATSQTSNQQNTISSFENLSVSTFPSENKPLINESRGTEEAVAPKNKEKPVGANNSLSSSPSSPEVGSTTGFRRMKVKDISEYMIHAARENPQLARKIHEVLLENGVVAPPDLFSEDSMEEPKDLIVCDATLFQSKDEMKRRMNEVGSREYADRGHGPSLSHRPGHELQSKVVPHRALLDSLKPVEGLGIYHHPDIRDNTSPYFSHYEPSAPPQETPSQLSKQLPVTAAAVATAAVVASSMVVAAAKSNSDMKFDVPVAAAATVTAAAVVATTAAVSKQYEHSEPGNQLLSLPSTSERNESVEKAADDFWDKQHTEIGHGQDNALDQERDSAEVPREAERTSDKSSGTESAKSEVTLDDVAEFEMQLEEIAIGERIGLGSFGEVYRGEWHGTEVAVKKFLQQDISSDALDEFKAEVRIMKRLRHPNVVLFMGAITRVPNLSIVTEFLPRGSLFRLIHRPNNLLDEKRRLRMALDVARGMNYLHNCTPVIVHRDLKSPNLLVDKNWVVKVCDFGLSRMKNNTFLSSRSTAGTAEWMAPEVLRNEPSDEKCDVFSYGVILWELCTLQQPWEGMNAMQVVGAVGFQSRRLDIPDNVDPAVAEIITRCWQTDPRARPSFAEIMAALKPLLKPVPANQAPRQRVQQAEG